MSNHMKHWHNVLCPVCQMTLESEADLEKHLLAHHAVQCPICPKKYSDKQGFTEHFKADHDFVCSKCGKDFVTEDDVNKHIETVHTNKCTKCGSVFETRSLLEIHLDENHNYSCPICYKSLKDNSKLEEHIKNNHTYDCKMCDFEGTTETIMENHILEKHFKPNEENLFCCDECNYKSENRDQLLKHYRCKHKENSDDQVEIESVQTANTDERKAKEELRVLKSNFQRLEVLFKNSVEEVKTVKSEYEAKLIEAHDKFRTVKAENEELKEKVDVLFKLGRSYINRKEIADNTAKSGRNETPKEADAEIIEVETIDADEDLITWTKNKFRGFKRSSPTTPPVEKIDPKPTKPSENKEKKNPPKKDAPSGNLQPTASLTPTDRPSETPENSTERNFTERILYCHYFSNYGRCNFEERTGSKCRFEHRAAPVCQSGTSCKRSKCMYKHPNVGGMAGKMPFLGQNGAFPPMMNPWMNPWMNTNQIMNPWNMEQN